MSATNSTVEFESLNRLSQNLTSIPEQTVLHPSSTEARNSPSKSPAQLYFNQHQILEHIEVVVNELANTMPCDPHRYIQDYFAKLQQPTSNQALTGGTRNNLSIQILRHFPDESTQIGSPKSQVVESKLPAEEVDHKFASYLSNLASSVRRGTS